MLGLVFILQAGLGLFQPAALVADGRRVRRHRAGGRASASPDRVGHARSSFNFSVSAPRSSVFFPPRCLAWITPSASQHSPSSSVGVVRPVLAALDDARLPARPRGSCGPFIYARGVRAVFDWLIFFFAPSLRLELRRYRPHHHRRGIMPCELSTRSSSDIGKTHARNFRGRTSRRDVRIRGPGGPFRPRRRDQRFGNVLLSVPRGAARLG